MESITAREGTLGLLRFPERIAAAGAASRLWPTILLATGLSSGAVLAWDAFVVEPDLLEASHHLEYVSAWRRGAPDLTLVHLTDLHVERLGERERRLIAIVNGSRPDVVVVTGDLLQEHGDRAALETVLASLRAARGKFLVWGNHDHAARLPEEGGAALARRAGFVPLANANARLATPAGPLVVAGVDDPATGRDNLRRALTGVARADLTILLSHSPEIVRNLGAWDVDIVLAGHTHGGQIVPPLFGPLWMPDGTRPYIEGWFDVSGDARLHVSRGVGTSGLPARFLCPPRVDVITLRGGPDPRARTRSTTAPA